MLKYSLFVSDFDGTLVRADGTISAENRAAIAAYRRAGGIFAIATGRMPSSIRPRLAELGISDGLVACYQGAVIVDLNTGKDLKCTTFSNGEAAAIVGRLEDEGHHVHAYTRDVLYCNRGDEALALYERVCGVKGRVVEGRLSDFVKNGKHDIVKILVMVSLEEQAKTEARMREEFGENYYVTRSSRHLIEVLPKGQDKGSAIDFFSEYFKIDRSRIAAIGDQNNDRPLIGRAGGKFAVGNAQNELKEIARVVASCEEHGVAQALKICMEGGETA